MSADVDGPVADPHPGRLRVVLYALLAGHQLVLPRRIGPEEALRPIERERVNVLVASPDMLDAMHGVCGCYRYDSLSLVVADLPADPDTARLPWPGGGGVWRSGDGDSGRGRVRRCVSSRLATVRFGSARYFILVNYSIHLVARVETFVDRRGTEAMTDQAGK
jgi:hypothetical protein